MLRVRPSSSTGKHAPPSLYFVTHPELSLLPSDPKSVSASGTYPTAVFDLFYYFDLSALSGSQFVLIIYEIRCHLTRVREQGSTINGIWHWLEGYFEGVMIDILVDIEGLIDV